MTQSSTLQKLRLDKTLTASEAAKLISDLARLLADAVAYAATTYDEDDLERGLAEEPAFSKDAEPILDIVSTRKRIAIRIKDSPGDH